VDASKITTCPGRPPTRNRPAKAWARLSAQLGEVASYKNLLVRLYGKRPYIAIHSRIEIIMRCTGRARHSVRAVVGVSQSCCGGQRSARPTNAARVGRVTPCAPVRREDLRGHRDSLDASRPPFATRTEGAVEREGSVGYRPPRRVGRCTAAPFCAPRDLIPGMTTGSGHRNRGGRRSRTPWCRKARTTCWPRTRRLGRPVQDG